VEDGYRVLEGHYLALEDGFRKLEHAYRTLEGKKTRLKDASWLVLRRLARIPAKWISLR
jgi:hypothetical protein